MAENAMKEIECFEKDYQKLYDKGSWNKDELAMMKDLKKLVYYTLVIDSMKNGGSYPGEEYMPDGMSGRRMRNPMNGQYMSGNGMYRGMDHNGSGMYHYPYMDGGMYYDGSYNDMRSSGRRYYDSEKEKAIHKLHHMMENEDNAEKKNALKLAITELEQK